MTPRVGVITFPGSLDDKDAARAVRLAGGESVSLWHADANLHSVDAVVLPGGFSYGDYLRCGAIAKFAPVMEKLVEMGVNLVDANATSNNIIDFINDLDGTTWPTIMPYGTGDASLHVMNALLTR